MYLLIYCLTAPNFKAPSEQKPGLSYPLQYYYVRQCWAHRKHSAFVKYTSTTINNPNINLSAILI